MIFPNIPITCRSGIRVGFSTSRYGKYHHDSSDQIVMYRFWFLSQLDTILLDFVNFLLCRKSMMALSSIDFLSAFSYVMNIVVVLFAHTRTYDYVMRWIWVTGNNHHHSKYGFLDLSFCCIFLFIFGWDLFLVYILSIA